jgi:putative transposase
MRQPRLKPEGRDVFYHVYNRIAGTRLDLPFGPVEKDHFLSLLRRLLEFYTIEALGFVVMGNHYHLLLFAPADPPSDDQTCARYAAFYPGKQPLRPGSRKCQCIARRLRDVSWLLHDLQHQFTAWFNRTRPIRRRGSLWAGRFKHTLLEEGLAVWHCWSYIEMNPVRAGLTQDPADYRFSSFGQWSARGRHPFAQSLENRLLPSLRGLLGTRNLHEVQMALQRHFALIRAMEKPLDPNAANPKTFSKPLLFRTLANQRMRYWTDGLLIGSQAFIIEVVTAARGPASLVNRRLTPEAVENGASPTLCCLKRLRDIPI